ncbi:FkbM family methyltransferase [Mesorhizobium sp. SP-1A]|uniref:FkbM family methyltransferase n=1 Tax=Mesorhizobium sp. SP-1A TaxID=3077840 RepID=UPI0028F73774|nr:FkbM family methyltransferase [Mesorhizobium sp. SP-1A]
MGFRKSLRRLKKRTSNALDALRLDETSYRLDIREIAGFKVALRQGTADESVVDESFDQDIFFSGVPEYLSREDDVVIDVGAHIGTFSLLAARRSPRGTVHAIEASRESYNYLTVNAALNGLGNLKPHLLALSNSQGTVTLHHDSGNWGHSIMKRLSAKGEQVKADTLGHFMEENGIERCSFVKFNCEGAEFPILMNAADDDLAKIDMMLILYHEDLAEGFKADRLIDRLTSAGFATKVRKQEKLRGWIIAQRKAA